jgi:hypothetical protein
MTAPRDPDRLIHAFLLEGAEQLQDQVYDVVRAEIDHKRQRVVIGPWRVPTVSKLVPIGLGAAALIAVLFFGSRFIGSPDASVGGPSSDPSPTPQPSAAAATSAPGGFLPEGPFLISDPAVSDAGPLTTVTIPSTGWTHQRQFALVEKGDEVANLPEAALVAWSWPAGTEFYVYGDPCRWSVLGGANVSEADGIAAALATQASRNASEPVDVTVGGYAGKHITLHVPEDADFSDCDEGEFASYGLEGDTADSLVRTHQGPGQVDELWILDVDGSIVILDAMYRPDSPDALVEELRSVAESATFE